MRREVIRIDQDLCVGCELCIKACHQGAIELIEGKATLISDSYCDGLGRCLPNCPTGAITIETVDTDEFNEERRDFAVKHNHSEGAACGCPSSAPKTINQTEQKTEHTGPLQSKLRQWPVQLHLVHPQAPYLENANILIAADCVPFAYANFHNDFINNHVVLVGCPKLDDVSAYLEKLSYIFSNNNINSVKVVKMEVPCCGGISHITRQALQQAGKFIPYSEYTVTIDGQIRI